MLSAQVMSTKAGISSADNKSPPPPEYALVTAAVEADDNQILESMGYTHTLHRGLHHLQISRGFTEVSVLASFVSMFGYGLQTGGPSAIVWGFVIVSVDYWCLGLDFIITYFEHDFDYNDR